MFFSKPCLNKKQKFEGEVNKRVRRFIANNCEDLEWLVRHYAASERAGWPVTALPAGSVRNLKEAGDMICRRMQYTDTEYIPAIIRNEILRYLQENNKSTLN